MARTFGRGLRQIRDASHKIQEDIKNAAIEEPSLKSNDKLENNG